MNLKPVQELQATLGERIKRLRLSRNLDQQTTAEKAGISLRALGNLEGGRGSTVETLLRTLRALDHLEGIETLAPEITVDPLALIDSPKPQRRVRRKRSEGKGAR